MILAILLPSMLATMIVLILNTLSLLAGLLTITVELVSDKVVVEVFPVMVVTPTMFGAAIFYNVKFLIIFIYNLYDYDLRGGSEGERSNFKAIDLDGVTVGTFVNPDPSPINVVAVTTPTVACCVVINPTVVMPVKYKFPLAASSPTSTESPEGTSTGPLLFLFVRESTLTLKLMIGMVKDLRDF